MSSDPSKVQDNTDWPTPTNPTEVHQFLGLASYYRRYIFNFSNIAGPLYSFTQKMEGMLCRWALAMQKYDFTTVHWKGLANNNANALSWLPPPSCTLTIALPHYSLLELKKAQMLDPIISVVHKV